VEFVVSRIIVVVVGFVIVVVGVVDLVVDLVAMVVVDDTFNNQQNHLLTVIIY